MTEALILPPRDAIATACKEFDNAKVNPDPALSLLFSTFPLNEDFDQVLLKVTTLNATYTTSIRPQSDRSPTIYDVSRHIVSLAVDDALSAGDVELVERIAQVEAEDGRKARNYSFATKYCSWHRPELYPIYDSRVDVYIWHLNKEQSFYSFNRNDLYCDYEKFRNIIAKFREHFGLEEFSFKEIDKFLYLSGAKWLEAQPSTAASKPEIEEAADDRGSDG